MTEVEALQAALAGEHACVYGYGVVGAVVPPELDTPAREGHDTHRARRDELTGLVRAAGTEPVAALAGYALPFPVATAEQATAFAALLEERQAVPLADVVGAAGGAVLRERAAAWLTDAAVRGAGWSGTVAALPGVDPPG